MGEYDESRVLRYALSWNLENWQYCDELFLSYCLEFQSTNPNHQLSTCREPPAASPQRCRWPLSIRGFTTSALARSFQSFPIPCNAESMPKVSGQVNVASSSRWGLAIFEWIWVFFLTQQPGVHSNPVEVPWSVWFPFFEGQPGSGIFACGVETFLQMAKAIAWHDTPAEKDWLHRADGWWGALGHGIRIRFDGLAIHINPY